MAVVHTVVYVDGAPIRTDTAPAEALAEARSRGGFAWVGVTGATADEVRSLGASLGLNRLGVEESLRGHQRSKLDSYDHELFLVLQPAHYDDAAETVECHEVDLFVTDHLVVAITADTDRDLEAARTHLESRPTALAGGALGVVWAITEDVTRGYRDVLDGIENDIDEIEEELFGRRSGVSHRIFALQREVIDLQHATAPLGDIIDRLRALASQQTNSMEESAFAEVSERAQFVDSRVTAFRQTLDNALTTHATLVNQRTNDEMREMTRTSLQQNEQVKKISSWAAIGLAPTLVAGIYGMNFHFMPELQQPWGYPFALGLMVAISGGLYIAFKRKNWI